MVFHDVSPGRTVDPHLISGALGAALRARGRPVERNDRFDSDGWVGLGDALETYNRRVDGLMLREAGSNLRLSDAVLDLAQRTDSLPAGAGAFPREFEFIRTQILEEKRQPLTAMQYFPVDSSVPLGARKHTARRALGSGEALIYGGGNEIPRAQTSFAEEQFGVAYVVCAAETNFFDALTTDFAGLQLFQKDLRLAVRLVEERLNRIAWFGDVGSQLYGAINYPSLAKTVVSTAFTDASDPDDVATALGDLATTPLVVSGGTFSCTDMLVSPKIGKFLFTRPTALASNMFIGQLFLAGQAAMGGGIRSIQIAPELAGIGPNSEDGILCYRKDLDTLGHVVIQPPTTLPVYQSSPLDQTTVVFAATGGVVMQDVGNAILGLCTVS